ncbi:bifunctional diaminohydroxyphosphoribosylaminopyrimidine deaminase/5-amino-6-(5-phosphoribosylamino)uracil reductase RibD [bacterium]|nr:bifunctional diaminohydroxyphosphoribosylaminopyrimidine deaminase/5-amino-6-(5-phosphoribosylamino)uracil reductase RibD [bacterium]
MNLDEDEKWLKVALEEGRKGVGLTAPNPPVGAVLVKNGVELARGWHQKVGSPHAERGALAKVTAEQAAGASAYVTLEPCSTEGRTGACTTALIKAGVARVVYGSRDPNPAHVGMADQILRDAGIEVVAGVCQEECDDLIRGFRMVQTRGRPWVIAKTAMSLDGRITRPPGEGQWLTGAEAREQVHLLRGEVDAILTSGETLRSDDPALTIRSEEVSSKKVQPWRVVLSRSEIEKERYQVFTDEFRERSLLFQNVDLYESLRTLAGERQVNTVLLEAGGNLLGAFSDQGLIDEWVIYVAPLVLGGPDSALRGSGAGSLEERLSLKGVKIEKVGNDLCARGVVDRSGPAPLQR